MLEIYKNIKSKRIELNLTQSDLASLLGYADKSMIAKIEKGAIDLPQSKIMAFSKVLHIEPGELMGWDSEPIASSVAPMQLSAADQHLLNYYHLLNKDGQKKLCERAEELLELGYIAKGVEKIE